MPVVRFGVSLEKELLEALDQYVDTNKFANRSQAIRRLISENMVVEKWQCNNIVVGSITIVYDHHKRDLLTQLNDVQHDYYEEILASQHLHLDHNSCMEIIAVKGKASVLTELSDKLIAIKGVQHGKLIMSKVD